MKEYKYDSDKDRIVAEEDLKPEPYGSVCVNIKTIFTSSMLDALRCKAPRRQAVADC